MLSYLHTARQEFGGDYGFFVSWLSTVQSIVELDRLCRQVAHSAERLANVVIKQQPSVALLPKPTDLYTREVEV